jgi:hypothetical protein
VHFYNHEDDIERLVAGLAELSARRSPSSRSTR